MRLKIIPGIAMVFNGMETSGPVFCSLALFPKNYTRAITRTFFIAKKRCS